MTLERTRRFCSLSISIVAIGMAGTAIAQTETVPAGSPAVLSSQLEDIVVTAERRSANLQDVPISVNAFTGAQLDRAGVANTLDLASEVPGMSIGINGNQASVYLRGIGSEFTNIGGDQTVPIYINDIVRLRQVSAVMSTVDVERVEVLKGPQGTLYGRNATGGAVKIVQFDPTFETTGSADVTFGNYDLRRARAVVNVPLVDDRVALRVAAVVSERDGYTRNLYNNTTLDDEDVRGVRAQLLFKPADDLRVIIRGDYTGDNSTRDTARRVLIEAIRAGIAPAPVGPYAIATNQGIFPSNPRDIYIDTPIFSHTKDKGIEAKAEWSPGDVRLTSLSAYRRSDVNILFDGDSTQVRSIDNTTTEFSKMFSQELQLASDSDGPLKWIGGLYYLTEDLNLGLDANLYTVGAKLLQVGFQRTNSYAGFGQATYEITDALRATVGLRFSRDEKKGVTRAYSGLNPPPAIATLMPVANAIQNNAWTPKFELDYKPIEDAMIYGSVTRGYKSGGLNARSATNEAYKPEFIWAYEVGLKSTLLDKRLRFNLAGFYYDYSDLQVQITPSLNQLSLILNAAKATYKGAELDSEFAFTPGLRVGGNLTYLDATYDKLRAVNPYVPFSQIPASQREVGANGQTTGAQILDNNVPQRAPKWASLVYLQYAYESSDLGVLTFRGEWQYQSKIYFDFFNVNWRAQPDYSMFNASLSWQSPDDHWSAMLFGRNLTDELVYASIGYVSSSGPRGSFLPPRTFGVQLGYHF